MVDKQYCFVIKWELTGMSWYPEATINIYNDVAIGIYSHAECMKIPKIVSSFSFEPYQSVYCSVAI